MMANSTKQEDIEVSIPNKSNTPKTPKNSNIVPTSRNTILGAMQPMHPSQHMQSQSLKIQTPTPNNLNNIEKTLGTKTWADIMNQSLNIPKSKKIVRKIINISSLGKVQSIEDEEHSTNSKSDFISKHPYLLGDRSGGMTPSWEYTPSIHFHDLNSTYYSMFEAEIKYDLETNTTYIPIGGVYPEVQVVNPEINIDEIEITEINYEQTSEKPVLKGKRLTVPNNKIINHIKFKAHTEEVKEQLHQFGLLPSSLESSQNSSVYTLYPRELTWIILHGQSKLKDMLVNKYNLRIVSNLVYTMSISQDPIYIQDNTRQIKFKQWQDKMKMLGLDKEYEVVDDGLRLLNYTGNEKNPILPPVRVLDTDNKFIRQLVIPSTVEVIENIRIPLLETVKIELTKATRLHKVYNPDIFFRGENKEVDITNLLILNHKNYNTMDGASYNVKLNYLHLIGSTGYRNNVADIQLIDKV